MKLKLIKKNKEYTFTKDRYESDDQDNNVIANKEDEV